MPQNKETNSVANEMKVHVSFLHPLVLVLMLACLLKYGLLSNLPVHWLEATYNGRTYFYNSITGVSQWEKPLEVAFPYQRRAEDLVAQSNKLRRKPFRLKPNVPLSVDHDTSSTDRSFPTTLNQSLSVSDNSSAPVSLQTVETVVLFLHLLRLEELLKGEVENRLILEENIIISESEQRKREHLLLARRKKLKEASNSQVRKLKEKIRMLENGRPQALEKHNNKQVISTKTFDADKKRKNIFSFIPQLSFRRRHPPSLLNETSLGLSAGTACQTSAASTDNLSLKVYCIILLGAQAAYEERIHLFQSSMSSIFRRSQEKCVSLYFFSFFY
jgi:hypothetical protein